MPLNSLVRGLGKRLIGYGAAPTSAVTPPFMGGAAMPDANSGMYDQEDDQEQPEGAAPPPPPEPEPMPPPSQQSLNGPPGPPPLRSLEQPAPSASSLAPPPPKAQSAREQALSLQPPKAGGIGRQLAAAGLSLIPGVNMTDIPRNVAYPGISDYLRKRQLLKDQAALEHQATQEDLTRMQRDAYAENVAGLKDTRKQNADTRVKTEQSNEIKGLGPWAEPVDDPNLPAGIAPLLSPEEQGKYVLRQAGGKWFKVPTRAEALRLEAESKGKGLVPVPDDLKDVFGEDAQVTNDQIIKARNAKRTKTPTLPPDLNAALVEIGAKDPTSPTPEEMGRARRKVQDDRIRVSRESRPIVNNTIQGMPAAPAAGGATLSGDDFLKTLPPGVSGQVKAIAEGRAQLPSGASRSPAAQQIRSAVFQYDPSYSDQRAQVRRTFTSGPEAKNIGALNTASVHLDQLDEASKAMKNGSFVPGNQLYNYLSRTFGSSAVTNFENLKSAVAGEMANALKGVATDVEIKNISGNIMGAQSPEQLSGAVDTNLHTLGAKLKTYQERYQQQIPGDTVWSPVLPSAKRVYQKHGFDPTGEGGGPSPSPAGGGIRVKRKSDGQTGTINPADFNPSKYDKL